MTIQEYINIYNSKQTGENKCKYLIAFDLESTGLDFNTDQIIQMAMIKYDVDTMKPTECFSTLFRPDIKIGISLGAYLKHGLTLDDLKDSPHFSDLCDEIIEYFGGNDTGIVGYNIKGFDLPFLNKKLTHYNKHIDFTHRFIYDVYEIERHFNKMDQCSVFYKYFNKPPEEMGMKRHDARGDIKMFMCIMNRQLDGIDNNNKTTACNDILHYNNIIDNNNFVAYNIIDNTCFDNINGTEQLVFTKGKYYNCPVRLVNLYDPDYIQWVKRTQSQECINEINKAINNK